MKKPGYQQTIYACYFGYIVQAITNNIAPLLFVILSEQFGISLEKITLLVTFNFGIQLLVDLLSVKFVDRLGYRTCMMLSQGTSALGLLCLATLPWILPAYGGILIAVVLYAIGGGLSEVLVSPIVEACPTENKSAVMSLLHSFYCWGTVAVVVLSTGFLYLFGKQSWPWLCLLWTIVPAVNTVSFSRVPIATLTEEGEGMPPKALFSTGLFWVFLLLMVAAGASEQAMSQWASTFAEKGLGISKTLGDLTGPCMFSVFMGLARVFYAKCSEKIHLTRFVLGSGLLCIVSYLLAALVPIPGIGLAGCALCGLSVGILWPGVFSIASARFPKGGTALFALLALAGDVGCGSGPTLVGMVASAFGDTLQKGLLAAIVFPVLLVIGICLLRRMKTEA